MPKYCQDTLSDMIIRLQRIQKNDKMTKKDADELLLGAHFLNWMYLKHTGEYTTVQEVKGALKVRVQDALTILETF